MGSLPDSQYIIQTDGYWFVEAHDVDPSKGYITVSAKGIVNGLSNQPNDGADFGPDSYNPNYSGSGVPYTTTDGVSEAVVYAFKQLYSNISNTVEIRFNPGQFNINSDITIPTPPSAFPEYEGVLLLSGSGFKGGTTLIFGNGTNGIVFPNYKWNDIEFTNLQLSTNGTNLPNSLISAPNGIDGNVSEMMFTNVQIQVGNFTGNIFNFGANSGWDVYMVNSVLVGTNPFTINMPGLSLHVSNSLIGQNGSVFNLNAGTFTLHNSEFAGQYSPNCGLNTFVGNNWSSVPANSYAIVERGNGGYTYFFAHCNTDWNTSSSTVALISALGTVRITITGQAFDTNGASSFYLVHGDNVDASILDVKSIYGATLTGISDSGFTNSLVPTTPTVPASGTAQTNNNFYPVNVYLYGGTVTVIDYTPAGGSATQVGTSGPATVRLNPGDAITLTYSGTPTWNWVAV